MSNRHHERTHNVHRTINNGAALRRVALKTYRRIQSLQTLDVSPYGALYGSATATAHQNAEYWVDYDIVKEHVCEIRRIANEQI